MKSIWLWFAVLISGLSLFGQANLGSITGTVRDQSGAVVANAPVELRNAETGALYSAGASGTGNYTIPVPAGTYELTVAVAGFRQYIQTGIRVVEGAATRRDVQLELGQATESITITDTAPLLKTEGGDVAYRVETQQANKLPVLDLGGSTGLGNIRNPLSMTQLLPGVDFNSGGFDTLTVNGLPANSQTWTVDGQDATPTLWRGVGADRGQGGVDAIEAMSVQTSSFAAEFGKVGGAAINFTMKSGGNDYHGTVYDYYVNEFLHAGTPNTDYANQGPELQYKSGQHIRNRQRRNDYGFTIGGPVVIPKMYDGHDKLFFFFNFEQFRETQTIANGLTTVPTAAIRNGDFTSNGCFSYNPDTGVCNFRPGITQNGQPAMDPAGNPIINGGIYDPSTYRIVDGFPVRDLFPGQQVPVSSFDKVATNIQALFPMPTNNNLTNNYNIPAYQNYRRTTIPSIKLDYVLSDKMRLSGYWGQNRRDQNNANGFDFKDYPFTSAQKTPYLNHTVRINFDATITPTLLLHIGVGYFHQKEPNIAYEFDQSKIGLPAEGAVNAFPYAKAFPTIGGLCNGFFGLCFGPGFGPSMGASFDATAWEQKPTGNANLTWVKGNHTLKFGGDLTIEGYPNHNRWRANGNFSFNPAESGNPWTNGQNLSINNPTGSNYASFLLGAPDSLDLAQQTFTKLGGHAFDFYLQDNWKVTPKLTVELGLRYDFQTYLREQYGRHASASFSTFNPVVGRLGGIAYEGGGPCACRLSSNYPFAFGPRASVAYQIDEKTVFRAGFGINYNVVQTPAGNEFSVGDFYQIRPPGFGITPLTNGLQGGNVFYKGNPYGNTEVVWPVFDPGRIPPRNAGLLPPTSPFSMYHPGSRPARITQWSIGLQREVIPNLVIEATYVGNRGAWFYAPLLDTMASNTLAGGQLGLYGLDIANAADRTLLTQIIDSPQAAARGFGLPYDGFPGTQQVGQALRPIPQWTTTNPYLGPNRGNTWYDSLQFQATKRYSHNLDMQVNFTWAHGMVIGSAADTDFFLRGRPLVTDPFNRSVNKQLNQLVPPLKTVISLTYTTPGFEADSLGMRVLSHLLKDWTVGAVLQYQSGQLLTVPNSNNQLSQQLRINLPANGFFSGVANYNPWNYIKGAPFFRQGFDPNGDFDPRQYNPDTPTDPSVASYLAGGIQTDGTCAVATCAWTNPAPGQWGSTAPFLEGFRWRRQPSENFNIGRNFRFGPESRFILNIRAEFTNILNRMFYSAPDTSNPYAPVTTTTQQGNIIPTGGYGVVNTLNGRGSSPRQGTIVARIQF